MRYSGRRPLGTERLPTSDRPSNICLAARLSGRYLGGVLEEIARVILRSKRGVVLTGAGISAESGVPTFRGKEGLWGKFKPEELATMEAFIANPKIVWEWYLWRRELLKKVSPNPGHYALTQLAQWFDDYAIITQNVDGLHRLAGSERVLEIHGNINRNKCAECGAFVEVPVESDPLTLPHCGRCGGAVRPDVVWFGEFLPEELIDQAVQLSERSDVFFSVGTSGLVHPAAGLPLVAKRHKAVLIEINPEETPLTPLADYALSGKSGEVLPELLKRLQSAKMAS